MALVKRLQVRWNTAAGWSALNLLLLVGEQAYETDTGKLKIGDGVSYWNTLPYLAGGGGEITYFELDGGNATSVYTEGTFALDMGAAT
jgi:hypothetical protein